MGRALLLALAASAAAFIWWRSPPRGVVRLDSGMDNGAFSTFDGQRRLFYAKRGFAHDIVNSVDLATRGKASRRLWGRRIKSATEDGGTRIKLIADNGDRAPKDARYTLMSLNGDDWTIRREEARAAADPGELMLFDTPYRSSTEAVRAPGLNDAHGMSTRLEASGVEVRLLVGDALGPPRFYPTPARPAAVVYASPRSIVVAYPFAGDGTRLEEILPFTRKRRPVADLKGELKSMAMAGDGLVAVRAVAEGTRLSFVSVPLSKQLLDIAWSKGGSTLLGASPELRTLYFSMAVRGPDDRLEETAWAVPMDHAALREAGDFFSRMHAWPELRWKLIGHAVEIAIAVFLLCAGLFFLGTFVDV